MNDEKRVFDVSGPQPTQTSRPIIVGHHPTMSDPMVRRPPTPTISKRLSNEPAHSAPESHLAKSVTVPADIKQSIEKFRQPLAGMDISEINHQTTSAPQPPSAQSATPMPADSTAAMPTAVAPKPVEYPAAPPPGQSQPVAEPAQPPQPQVPDYAAFTSDLHLQPLPVAHMKSSGRLKIFIIWIIVVLLLTGAGLYLLIDSGVISTNINLPVHIIKSR